MMFASRIVSEKLAGGHSQKLLFCFHDVTYFSGYLHRMAWEIVIALISSNQGERDTKERPVKADPQCPVDVCS